MDIQFVSAASQSGPGTAISLYDKASGQPSFLIEVDSLSGGDISRALKGRGFEGKAGQTVTVEAPHGSAWDRVIVAGLGDATTTTAKDVKTLGAGLIATLKPLEAESATVFVEVPSSVSLGEAEFAAQIALGATLRAYTFRKYLTKKRDDDTKDLQTLTIACQDPEAAKQAWYRFRAVAEGVYIARDLGNEPANTLHPRAYAERIKDIFDDLDVEVEVLGEKQLKKIGMGALLGVGQGSACESQVVIMTYTGAPRDKGQPLALVGKGVTFDTGGISIKPSANMDEMKLDMMGSAAVVGTMRALAARRAKVNVIGAVGLVENMPASTAQRPGDIVTSLSGQTIEVLNTDAEGRLVLADVLWYVQERFKPHTVIDLATLTGAVIVALGTDMAGFNTPDDAFASRISEAGESVGETMWRLPLTAAFDKAINSPVADMKNIAEGRSAGSSIGGQFLKRFVKDDVTWAHLDIAGVMNTKKDTGVTPKGPMGFGVQLLDELVARYFETV